MNLLSGPMKAGKKVIDLDRFLRGVTIADEDAVCIAPGKWSMKSQSEKTHHMITKMRHSCDKAQCGKWAPPCMHRYVCNCDDRCNPCKHIYKIHSMDAPEEFVPQVALPNDDEGTVKPSFCSCPVLYRTYIW